MLGRANARTGRSLRVSQLHWGPTRVTPSTIATSPSFFRNRKTRRFTCIRRSVGACTYLIVKRPSKSCKPTSGVATGGGETGQLAPPPLQPPIGHPVRSMQIRGDFHVWKNGGRFTGFVPTFYMHRRYGERSLVLRLRKKREEWRSCWRSYFGKPSVKLRSPLRSLSHDIGPPKRVIFNLFIIFTFKC